MAKRKIFDVRDMQLSDVARPGFTYFITRDTKAWYHWEFVNRDGDTLCSGPIFARKEDPDYP
jgi:hypothetical protein